MTKADLTKELHDKNGLSRAESVHMVELIIETIKANLAEGKKYQWADRPNARHDW